MRFTVSVPGDAHSYVARGINTRMLSVWTSALLSVMLMDFDHIHRDSRRVGERGRKRESPYQWKQQQQ